MSGFSLPKRVRFEEFPRRLRSLPVFDNHLAAKRGIDETLNAVEDEFSGVLFDPSSWRTDGRMYPVQEDRDYDVEGAPEVTSYISFKHETLVRENGAFEIRDRSSKAAVIAKVGSDGKGVWS